ncbi:MAG: phenylalanine--tRNA ligase subunit beta [Pseudomonadota bacterium]
MRFSEQWLREWVNPSVDAATLAAQLTMAGLEVDAVEPAAGKFNDVLVGQVLTVERHPDAERLTVCKVEVGAGEALQIVCGAKNVAAGVKVPVAMIGANLPNDLKIKKGKLRGVESFGMLCSAVELGLAETSDGLLLLPSDAPVGKNIRDYLRLDDHCIEVDLTPNRSDCLSIRGIAREIGVLNKIRVDEVVIKAVESVNNASFAVAVHAKEACPRYAGRVIQGIDPAAKTPMWMQERLRRSGIRCIHPVVDVTNYVMLELGQPMHGFDLAKLEGGLDVRYAKAGEQLTLLDGKTIELSAGSLLIADHAKPLALAGVMGGQDSGVSETTRDIFLESAFFAPSAVAGRARAYGLHTDSSHRFERGVDPELQVRAIERATELLLSITGGQPGPVTEMRAEKFMPVRHAISLKRANIKRILGMEMADQQVQDILGRLGLRLEPTGDGWTVYAPSYRFDIAIEVDLIEELGRIYGYVNLPVHRPVAQMAMPALSETQVALPRIRQTLVDRGYQEAITYSFVDPKLQQLLEPGQEGITLANPISADMSVMRTSLWAGLVQALVYNRNRQQEQVRLFEIGRTFIRSTQGIVQKEHLAGLVFGPVQAEQWGEALRKADFYDAKGDLEALLALGSAGKIEFQAQSHPALHPGQAARVLREGAPIGWIGALAPSVVKALDLPAAAFVYEIDLEALQQARVPAFKELSKYPSIRRDIAIVIDESVISAEVQQCIRDAAPPTLRNLKLFDIYRGKGIDFGKKSLAIALYLQDDFKTLTDTEVDSAVESVLSALYNRFNARLRD